MATAAQESKAEPVRTATSFAKLAGKTLHACRYPKQTEGNFREVQARERNQNKLLLQNNIRAWSLLRWTLQLFGPELKWL